MNNSDLIVRIASVIGTDEVVQVGFVCCLILTAIIALGMLRGIARGIYKYVAFKKG